MLSICLFCFVLLWGKFCFRLHVMEKWVIPFYKRPMAKCRVVNNHQPFEAYLTGKLPKIWDLYVATINMYKLKYSEFGLNHKKVIKIEQKCAKIVIFTVFLWHKNRWLWLPVPLSLFVFLFLCEFYVTYKCTPYGTKSLFGFIFYNWQNMDLSKKKGFACKFWCPTIYAWNHTIQTLAFSLELLVSLSNVRCWQNMAET